jgi:putative oxidoreductase
MEKAAMASASDALLLLGRVAIAAVFIPSGFSKLSNLDGFIASLDGRGVPFASILGPIGGLIEFIGGIAVVIGFQVRFASVLMILFTIAATLIAHRFWEFQGAQRQMQQTQFFKNLAIAGGFIFLMVNGGGRYCIDRLWHSASERRVLRAGRRATDRALPA